MARMTRQQSISPKIWLIVALVLLGGLGGALAAGASFTPKQETVEQKLDAKQLGL